MTRANDKVANSLCHPAGQLLRDFRPDDKRQFRKLKKRVDLEPGKYLVRMGDRPGKIFVHRRGDIQTIPTWESRKFTVDRASAAETVYGLTEALSAKGFDFSIKSITAAEFDVIENEDFFDFIRHRPELMQKLLHLFGTLYARALDALKEQ